jgi:hypothetical protein
MLKESLSHSLEGFGINYQDILQPNLNAGITKNTEAMIGFFSLENEQN